MDNLRTDTVDESVHELVKIAAIHRVEQEFRRSINTGDCRVRHSLLKIVGAGEIYASGDGGVVSCHSYSSLKVKVKVIVIGDDGYIVLDDIRVPVTVRIDHGRAVVDVDCVRSRAHLA